MKNQIKIETKEDGKLHIFVDGEEIHGITNFKFEVDARENIYSLKAERNAKDEKGQYIITDDHLVKEEFINVSDRYFDE